MLCAVLLALCFIQPVSAGAPEPNQNAQANTQPIVPKHRRRHRREVRRGGIKHSYGQAGKSIGHGSKRFGKNIAKGKPIKAGQEMGQGASGFGKNVGQGSKGVGHKSKKIGQKVVHKTKNVVNPPQ